MKALLINPHKLIPLSFSLTQRASPPLGLAFIAAALEGEGYQVQVVDCVAEAPSHFFRFGDLQDISALGIGFDELFAMLGEHYDVIGMSAMFSNNWLINRHLIDLLKRRYPRALTVIGGEHASAIPEYCLGDCAGLDVVVTGEGEATIAEVARAVAEGRPLSDTGGIVYKDRVRGEIVAARRRQRLRELAAIARPAWHLFPLEKYFANDISYGIAYGRSLPIFATRGCPYQCTFCSSPQMWGLKYSMRDVADVVDEIAFLNREYGVNNIDFYDLTAILKKQWILDFCRQLA
ncbi:MAG: cobalamin-dependent protein [Candidatus Binatia bacterium]